MHWIIHGHFYQPPRENPWTDRVSRQPSAAPYHDWNERISRECYRANAHSRILDEHGRIAGIVNNYEAIHFDFGPTLLRWIEREEPELYARILSADATSVRTRGGHGNAIAQAYSHMILPLANDRDRRTQILWGLRDFEHRFGRASESIWLPETACDQATLRLLVEFGIRYLILAPGQARRVRHLGGVEWTDVSGGRIDPRRAYRVIVRDHDGIPTGGISVFFYDGPLSAGISFNHYLRNAPDLASRMAGGGHGSDDLVHVATDGEVYGHHEPFGDMCLAYLTRIEAPRRGVKLTNYGEYLDDHPPRQEVELDFGPAGAGTSWSCSHGVARWREDCGCRTGGQPGWNQSWRGPLRNALDFLRDRLAAVYEERAGRLLNDPWRARDEAIDLILDPRNRDRFLDRHARRTLDEKDRTELLHLLDSQRHAMLMYTSCAWFFADLAGIEVRQNLAHAGRAIECVRLSCAVDLEREFLDRLAAATGNGRTEGSGADLYGRSVTRMEAEASLDRPISEDAHLGSSQSLARLVEERFASLLDNPAASSETFRACLLLLERVERSGLDFDRTMIEESVYDLLLSYEAARAAQSAGQPDPAQRNAREALIQLAERTNVSPDPLGPDSHAWHLRLAKRS